MADPQSSQIRSRQLDRPEEDRTGCSQMKSSVDSRRLRVLFDFPKGSGFHKTGDGADKYNGDKPDDVRHYSMSDSNSAEGSRSVSGIQSAVFGSSLKDNEVEETLRTFSIRKKERSDPRLRTQETCRVPPVPRRWHCSHCTYLNDRLDDTCGVCGNRDLGAAARVEEWRRQFDQIQALEDYDRKKKKNDFMSSLEDLEALGESSDDEDDSLRSELAPRPASTSEEDELIPQNHQQGSHTLTGRHHQENALRGCLKNSVSGVNKTRVESVTQSLSDSASVLEQTSPNVGRDDIGKEKRAHSEGISTVTMGPQAHDVPQRLENSTATQNGEDISSGDELLQQGFVLEQICSFLPGIQCLGRLRCVCSSLYGSCHRPFLWKRQWQTLVGDEERRWTVSSYVLDESVPSSQASQRGAISRPSTTDQPEHSSVSRGLIGKQGRMHRVYNSPSGTSNTPESRRRGSWLTPPPQRDKASDNDLRIKMRRTYDTSSSHFNVEESEADRLTLEPDDQKPDYYFLTKKLKQSIRRRREWESLGSGWRWLETICQVMLRQIVESMEQERIRGEGASASDKLTLQATSSDEGEAQKEEEKLAVELPFLCESLFAGSVIATSPTTQDENPGYLKILVDLLRSPTALTSGNLSPRTIRKLEKLVRTLGRSHWMRLHTCLCMVMKEVAEEMARELVLSRFEDYCPTEEILRGSSFNFDSEVTLNFGNETNSHKLNNNDEQTPDSAGSTRSACTERTEDHGKDSCRPEILAELTERSFIPKLHSSTSGSEFSQTLSVPIASITFLCRVLWGWRCYRRWLKLLDSHCDWVNDRVFQWREQRWSCAAQTLPYLRQAAKQAFAHDMLGAVYVRGRLRRSIDTVVEWVGHSKRSQSDSASGAHWSDHGDIRLVPNEKEYGAAAKESNSLQGGGQAESVLKRDKPSRKEAEDVTDNTSVSKNRKRQRDLERELLIENLSSADFEDDHLFEYTTRRFSLTDEDEAQHARNTPCRARITGEILRGHTQNAGSTIDASDQGKQIPKTFWKMSAETVETLESAERHYMDVALSLLGGIFSMLSAVDDGSGQDGTGMHSRGSMRKYLILPLLMHLQKEGLEEEILARCGRWDREEEGALRDTEMVPDDWETMYKRQQLHERHTKRRKFNP